MPVIGALRKLGRYLGIALAAAVLSAFVYEHVGAWRDGRVLTRVGHSIDIGGRSLNLDCVGEGRPIVIFESGRTSPGYVWTPSQRGVAAFTRACWYDRASIGWSEVHASFGVPGDDRI